MLPFWFWDHHRPSEDIIDHLKTSYWHYIGHTAHVSCRFVPIHHVLAVHHHVAPYRTAGLHEATRRPGGETDTGTMLGQNSSKSHETGASILNMTHEKKNMWFTPNACAIPWRQMTRPTRTFVNGWVPSVCCFGHCQLDCAKLQHVHLFRALGKESDGMRGTKLMIYGLIFDGDDDSNDSNDSFCYSYSYYVLVLNIYYCHHRNAN